MTRSQAVGARAPRGPHAPCRVRQLRFQRVPGALTKRRRQSGVCRAPKPTGSSSRPVSAGRRRFAPIPSFDSAGSHRPPLLPLVPAPQRRCLPRRGRLPEAGPRPRRRSSRRDAIPMSPDRQRRPAQRMSPGLRSPPVRRRRPRLHARPPPCGPGLLERSRCVTMHGRSAISPSHRPRRSGHPSCRMPPDLPYRRNRLCPSGSTIGVPEFQPARAAAAGSAPAPAASLTLPPAPSRPAPPRISIEIGRIEIRSSTRPTPTAARRVVAPRDHVIDPQLPFGRRRRGA